MTSRPLSRGGLLAASAVALAVGLAGCGASGAAPTPEPTPAPSSSPSAAPFERASPDGYYSPDNPPDEPTMPEVAEVNSARGAEAFVQYWVDVLNRAWFTGDTTELRRISSPDCQSCQNYIDSIEQTYPEQFNAGGAAAIPELTLLNMQSPWALFSGRWAQGESERFDSSSTRKDGGEPSFTSLVSFRVDRNGEWTMKAMFLNEINYDAQ